MSLPPGEVESRDVLAWAQEQAQFLTPTQAHVLLVLCANAWFSPNNPEHATPGDVLSGLTSLRKIQMKTGLSQRAVRYALDALQDMGYIVANHKPGHGQSEISVFWTENADEMRAEIRAGVRDLPEGMKRVVKSRKTRRVEGVVVPFRSGN